MAEAPYGDSYSAVQSADLQMQAARQQALQHSQALLQASFQNLQRAHEQQNELAYKYQALEQQKEQQARGLKVTSDYYDWLKKQETPGQIRSYDFKFQQASQDAGQGLIDSPEHAAKNYGLKPDDAQIMWERSQSVRPQYENDYSVAAHIADTLNRKNQLKNYAELSKQAAAEGTHIFGNDTAVDASGKKYKIPDFANERVKEFEAESANLPNYNPNDKRIASLVTFNPDTGEYESVISRPHWLDRKAAAAAPRTGNSQTGRTLNAATPPDDRPAPATGTASALPSDVSDANLAPTLGRDRRMGMTGAAAAQRDEGGAGRLPNGLPIKDALQRLRALRGASSSSIRDMPPAGPMNSGAKVLVRTSDGQTFRLPVEQLDILRQRDPALQVIGQ